MSKEQAEIHVVKCRGQVTLVRLTRKEENREPGPLSTLQLGTDPQLGFLYLQGEDYPLGAVFEVEITLQPISAEDFAIKHLKATLM